MVQTAFTWRYGGNQVFLCGSFNGWSERIPMVLLEGSATIFQKIIDLPPGCYQYKFLVDGAWLVDQQQICDPDEYGTINNIVLVTGTELMSPEINAEALQPSSSTLIAGSMGSSSRGLMNEPVPQLSDREMDLFYQVLSTHLLSSTIYELIPNSGKTFTLDVELEFEQAYHVMYEQGLVIMPLWDEGRSQMVGMLTASDFILILLQLHRNRATFANEIRTVSSWKNWKLQLHRDIIGTLVPLQRRPLIHVNFLPDVDDSIELRRKHYVCRHFQYHLGYMPLLRQPIGYLPLGTWAKEVGKASSRPLLTLKPNDPLIAALTLLLEGQISSVPIVDDGGNLISVYCRSDVTSLARDNIYTRIQLDQIMISQALEIRGETGRDRYKTCTRFDSLYSVMELLSEPDVRRVIVVEASGRRIEGLITLRDVFKLFSGEN
ncbi:hypothetical protein BUALT_Bualt02G0098300 [Buddleja alternifolia]|uniref:CBS domain-containing protein n=1 Tax=Buddleja alternifolia TaxID=168488 RepID=A0AAV6Y0K0_9LAMI|nr:hypothetical protein BUALT_Bualt02G0098300 [Buddleja alternifolia]